VWRVRLPSSFTRRGLLASGAVGLALASTGCLGSSRFGQRTTITVVDAGDYPSQATVESVRVSSGAPRSESDQR
jgi:hypothetical protein